MKRIKNYIFILIAFIIILYFSKPIFAFSPSSATFEGIDVSVYQGEINYEEVKDVGIDFVYIRSSEGTTYIDSYFRRNYEQAKANGLKVGFYHYLTARNVEEAKAQAEFFVNTIRGTSPDCKLAMDFESFGNLSIGEINEISITFLNTVKSLSGKDVIIYSDAYNARNTFDSRLTEFPLWVAEYGVQTPIENGKWENWAGWQYTSTGRVSGIDTYVDRDLFTEEVLLGDSTQIPGTPGVPTEESNEVVYIVKAGDTLSEIAARYNTTVNELVSLNNISNPSLIYVGQRIVIKEGDSTSSSASGRIVYRVKEGDTLNKIARDYNVSVSTIVRLNNIINPNLIYVGQNLIISNGSSSISSNKGTTVYIVKSRDTLSEIAARYNTTVNELVSLNNISNRNLIYVGERIFVPLNNSSSSVEHDTSHTLYIVKYGDTLGEIAREYDTTVAELVKLNNISNPNLIYVGERIRIP